MWKMFVVSVKMGFVCCDLWAWLCHACLREGFLCKYLCMHACVLCHCVLIKAYALMSPLPLLTLFSLFCYLVFSSVPVFPLCCTLRSCWYLFRHTSCFLFLLSIPIICSSRPSFLISQCPSTHSSFHRPKVISTGRPSMRIQCWRLRGAGSLNSSSLSPKASSHLKVSATSEVRSQAPTKGVISFFSIHVCVTELHVSVCMCERYYVFTAMIATVVDVACCCLMIC